MHYNGTLFRGLADELLSLFSEIILQWLWYMAQLTECLLTRLAFSFTLSTVCLMSSSQRV